MEFNLHSELTRVEAEKSEQGKRKLSKIPNKQGKLFWRLRMKRSKREIKEKRRERNKNEMRLEEGRFYAIFPLHHMTFIHLFQSKK